MSGPAARLALFACASLTLHAATLSVYQPSSSGFSTSAAKVDAVIVNLEQPSARTAPPNREGKGARTAGNEMPVSATALDRPAAARDRTNMAVAPGDGLVAVSIPEKWYEAGELDVRAEPLTAPNLSYPNELAAQRIAARVRIVLRIDENGWVQDARIVTSGPEPLLDRAALTAWQEVRFSPAMKDGQRVKSEKILEIDFTPD